MSVNFPSQISSHLSHYLFSIISFSLLSSTYLHFPFMPHYLFLMSFLSVLLIKLYPCALVSLLALNSLSQSYVFLINLHLSPLSPVPLPVLRSLSLLPVLNYLFIMFPSPTTCCKLSLLAYLLFRGKGKKK